MPFTFTPEQDETTQDFQVADGWYLATVHAEDSNEENTVRVKDDGSGGEEMAAVTFRVEDTPAGQEAAIGRTLVDRFINRPSLLFRTRRFHDAIQSVTSPLNKKLTVDFADLVGRRVALRLELTPYSFNNRSGKRSEIREYAPTKTLVDDSGGI